MQFVCDANFIITVILLVFVYYVEDTVRFSDGSFSKLDLLGGLKMTRKTLTRGESHKMRSIVKDREEAAKVVEFLHPSASHPLALKTI